MLFSFKNATSFFASIFFLSCISIQVQGQKLPVLKVNNFSAVLQTDVDDWTQKNRAKTSGEPQLVLLKFSKIRSIAEQQTLANEGINLQEYFGSNTYSALVFPISEINKKASIVGIADFLPEYKISNSIKEHSLLQKNVSIWVTFFKEISDAQVQQIVRENGGVLVPNKWQSRGYYSIQIASNKLKSFAAFYGVKFIGDPIKSVTLDLDSKGAIGAAVMNMPNTLGGKGLRGKDVIVGVGDNGSGIYHIDQRDRVINYNNGDNASHGIFVNGLIGGDGIMDPAAQGIATEGTCISLFFDAVIFLKDEMYKGFNVTLTNNSYRADRTSLCGYSGVYDLLSQNLDEMAFKTPQQLDIFASGNDGAAVCSGYPAGYFNIAGGFQTAKNILTVGSCTRELVVAASSSRGPLKDGRLKPEIIAPGDNVYGAVRFNTYTYSSGTSFACPQTTGILALLTERYKQLHSNSNPASDLLKAIAINGATDLGRSGPDFWYGFGLLNGVRSLQIIDSNWYVRNSLASGAAPKSFTITVPPNTAQLKVLLYYHDPVASASSSTQLINDLDITVSEPGGGTLHRPMILDTSKAGVGNNATEGTDRLNNAEQVLINNPAAGTYTVLVADYSIPTGPQDYVVVYDFVPNEIKLLFPIANASAAANSDMYIYWDAPASSSATTKVEFSANNGASWATIAAAVPASIRCFKWAVPTVNSNQCKIRLSHGGLVDVSGSFIINQQTTIALNTVQCAGSIAINWTNVPVADKYYMMLKKGPHFQKIDSVNAGILMYNFTGLKIKEDYYVAVMPAIGGMDGFRSKAITRRPNTGTCSAVLNGDLAIDSVLSPKSGRRFTSSQLSNKTPIIVNIRNQDFISVANFSVAYKVNSGTWKTVPSFSISANTNIEQVVDSFDFSDTLQYVLTIAVQNRDRTDPVAANDTIIKTFKHLPNNKLSLLSPIRNDFETLPDFTLLHDTIGLSKDGFWDYNNSNDTGRLRSRIPGSKLVKSNRSISMDVNMNAKSVVNYFTGTFNFSNYDTTADEVRFDFDYEMRGMPVIKDSNKVWARGSDTASWIPVFTYSNAIDTSGLHGSNTLSLREILRNKGQNFSTSTQIRFGQYDTTLIVDDNYGGGLTIDNVNIYKVSKDVQLKEIISPVIGECGITSAPLIINLKNGTTTTMGGITVGYSIDANSPVIEVLADSILGDDNLTYTFIKGLTGLGFGQHTLKVWLHVLGDDFLNNDTIGNYVFTISPLINSFPYLQNFESSDGYWYVGGRNPSWAYGIPSGKKINNAASGAKAWKTNLNGNYNNNELSFLTSPCIATIGLAHPMLSFSAAFDLERCSTLCDRVFIEFSTDNELTWNRLGKAGEGTNWYNNTVHNVWNDENPRWHVASFSLPRASQLKLRFVMATDLGTNFEGFAIDDIHIFNLEKQIATPTVQSETITVAGTAWFYFTKSDKLIAAIHPLGADKGLLKATAYGHNNSVDLVNRQYFFQRNWVVHRDIAAPTSSLLRFYITDDEVNKLWSDTSCVSCTRADDIYRTGVTQYIAAEGKNEDSSLLNNEIKGYHFYPYRSVQWVPYDNGYYAEITADGLGEFWLNDGGVLGTIPLNTEYLQLKARKLSSQQAEATWLCAIDTQMSRFQVERSLDSITFKSIGEVISKKSLIENYVFVDNLNPSEGATVFYRLLCTALNGKTFYSNIASVLWTKGDQLLSVYPVPSSDGVISIKWTGAIGSSAPFTLSDAMGKTILQSELKSTNWTNTSVLRFDYLAKGMYFLKLQIGANQYLEKVIFK